MAQYFRPKGTQDILPEDQPYWEHLLDVVATTARSYGFERIDVPIFEATELFARGLGEATDAVEKEMYAFKDKGDRDIALRPEFTAGVIRAYIENGLQVLPKPVKLYSTGPAFRYEEPQAGRYRQFHQFNVEILGVQSALADLEVMLLAWNIFDHLGFQALSFQINSTGCPQCRPGFVQALTAHYYAHMNQICDDCKRRIVQNPLRVLDCKQDRCQPVISSAPIITEMLCGECEAHFAELCGYLDSLKKPYTLNHRLVRGLDYYTKTVFEVWAQGIGAQAAVCGGGRYDGLAELLGGPSTPAVGFASGMERIVMVMKAQGVDVPVLPSPSVYVAHLGDKARTYAVQLLTKIRDAGISAQIAMGGSLRAQLRHADRRGARVTLIVGEDELNRGEITLRDMQSGDQVMVPLDHIVAALDEYIGE